MTHFWKRVRSNKGAAPLNVLYVFLIIFILMSIVMEYGRSLVIINGVKDSIDRSAIAVATDNAINSYNGFREGVSDAVSYNGYNFDETADSSAIVRHLVKELGLTSGGSGVLKKVRGDGSVEYTISKLRARISDDVSTDPNAPITFYITATIETPLKFVGMPMTTKTDVVVESHWQPKFM